MLLLLDVGNTNTHLGLSDGARIIKQGSFASRLWSSAESHKKLIRFVGPAKVEGASFCSVVPAATAFLKRALVRMDFPHLELTHKTCAGVGIDYPRPQKIGPDRLANSIAAHQLHGAPVVVVDFGTAVTFDVVNKKGFYVGGIIAPGLSVMTDYLHEKTALLPRIKIRDTKKVIGRNTREAMLIGAVHGYRGLVLNLLAELKSELDTPTLKVVATGGCAELISEGIPDIKTVDQSLTLKGLAYLWQAHHGSSLTNLK
ncbi:MAG: type pantothenate kinase [Verrucomicrobiales bacterium]|nr:type pantothenate kinase [Verrucomicrobiales bacterium]